MRQVSLQSTTAMQCVEAGSGACPARRRRAFLRRDLFLQDRRPHSLSEFCFRKLLGEGSGEES